MIKEKKILVNDVPVDFFKYEVKNWDIVKILGKSSEEKELKFLESSALNLKSSVLLFNKPKWYVVSKSDPHNKTIYELLPQEFQHWYYIWRLDKESCGLVLLTPKPDIVHQFEHPSNEIIKEYLVKVSYSLTEAQKKETKNWILSKNDKWFQELLKFKDIEESKHWSYKITLVEWKKRHIRRVFQALWNEVVDLQRIKEWDFILWDLAEWKRKLEKLS